MKKILILWLMVWLMPMALLSQSSGDAGDAYLFTSFREPSTGGMEYLYSYDGLHWYTIPGVVMTPKVGNEKPYRDAFTGEEKWPKFAPHQRCLRDPSIVQGPDGTFHLVWTVQWSGNRTFGYAYSKDLIHWSEQREIPVMESIPTNNVWAPELFYDDELDLFFIIWSSQIPPEEYTDADRLGTNACHRLYYTTTKDFKTFTPAKRYYDPGFNSIDGYLLKRAPKDYVLIVKDNRKPGFSDLFCVFSESPYGPFSRPTEKFGRTYSEGPCAVKMDNGEWIIYFDQYRPQQYGAVSTYSFQTFTPIPERISIPLKHKHGTVVKIKRNLLDKLLKHFAQDSSMTVQALVIDEECMKKATGWVQNLQLNDKGKEERVIQVIATHLTAISNWHDRHADMIPDGAINPQTGKKLSALDRQVIADSSQPSSIRQALLDGLNVDLTSRQIEQVLDLYTVGKVAFTMKAYKEIVPDMTADDEAFLMKNLQKARLMAIDYKNMKEISAIFEIYKTKNEQYFTNSGRDWRTMYSAHVKQLKARKDAMKVIK